MSWLWPIAAALATVAIVWAVARGWAGQAEKGGGDREARRQLEAMARRRAAADRKRAAPARHDPAGIGRGWRRVLRRRRGR